jgi:hypothetical protein
MREAIVIFERACPLDDPRAEDIVGTARYHDAPLREETDLCAALDWRAERQALPSGAVPVLVAAWAPHDSTKLDHIEVTEIAGEWFSREAVRKYAKRIGVPLDA